MIHYAYELCSALTRDEVDVTLVTSRGYELAGLPHAFRVVELMRLWKPVDPTADPRPLRRGLAAAGWRVRRSLRRGFRGLIFVREWTRLTRYLINERPDIIQLGKIEFPIEGVFLRWLRRRGLVLTDVCHEFERREHGGGLGATLATKLTRGAFTSFSAILFHDDESRQRFARFFGLPASRLYVMPHQGPARFFATLAGGTATQDRLRRRYGIADGERIVLFFGNLTPSKGLTDLLEAFPAVRRTTAARLLVTGFATKFVDPLELQERVDRLGIADSVTLDARYVPFEEVGPLMELASVVVYPYRTCTESGALQLAYLFGRPVVATDVGGLGEVVDDGRSGLLVPQGSAEELAAAISRILADPTLAARMGTHARHLAETRYTWNALADRILSISQAVRA